MNANKPYGTVLLKIKQEVMGTFATLLRCKKTRRIDMQSKSYDIRKKSEKEYHDDYFSGESESRKKQQKYYSKNIQRKELEYILHGFGDISGKKILIFGIGDHFSLIKKFAKKGANVVAIDISSEAVKKINNKIIKNNLKNNCKAIEMDCENISFDPDSFDFVFGRSIIHHLEILKTLQQINTILTKRGKFAFIEPLATNPIIQLYRYLTPKDRTPDEHPLTSADLSSFSQKFQHVQFKFLYALTILAFPVQILTKNEKLFMWFFSIFQKIDTFLLNIPFYNLLCWDVIISGEKKIE